MRDSGHKKAEERLRDSEAFLEMLLDAIPIPVFYKDREGRYLGFNQSYEAFFGATREQLVGKSVFDISPRELAEIYYAKDNELFETGGIQRYESRVKNKRGEMRDVIFNKAIFTDGQGEVGGLIGAILDITQRKQVEEALRESEARFRTFADHAADAFFLHDSNGIIIDANQRACESLGYSREELIGMRPTDIDADISQGVDKGIRKRLAAGEIVAFDSHQHRRDGTTFPVEVRIRPFHEGGNYFGLALVRDITERKSVEAVQQRMNRELRAISSCHQAMMRATDEQTLLNDICRIICDEGGYRMAWVGYVESDKEKTIHPVVWHGDDSDYMEQARLSWSGRTERGRGPAGEAVRSGKSFYVEDIATDPGMTPWREAALQRGYRSSLGVPLKDESGKVLGLLSVYASERAAFTKEAVRLIEGLANDMSFGISVLRSRIERQKTEEALRESEARFRTLVDHATDAFFLHDSDGAVIDVNHQACENLGYSREELIGMSPLVYDPELDDVTLKGVLERLDNTNEVIGFETLHRRKDGSTFPVELRIRSLWHGEHRVAICLARDITERKSAEVMQHRLNRELRAISSCHQVMMRATDEQSLLDDICRIICDEAGYRLAWVGYAERDEAMTVRPAAWAGDKEDTAYLTKSIISWSGDTPFGGGPAGAAIRSGGIVHVQDIASDPRMAPWRESALQRGYRCCLSLPLRDEHANVFGALLIYSSEPDSITPEEIRLMEGLAGDLAFGIDVLRTRAERTQAEEALRRSEERYRTIFESSPLGIFRSTVGGNLINANQAFAATFGYESPEAVVHDIDDVASQLYVRAGDRDKVYSDQMDAMGHTVRYRNHYRRRDGSEFIANLYVKTVYDDQGEAIYFDGIVEDMTEHIRAEEERERLQAQLLQAQKMESIGRLAGGIAHDFNNMLGVIIGYAELGLRQVEPSHPFYTQLRGIREAAGSSANLTRQLLAFARKQTITPTVLDLNETVEGMLKMLRRMIGEDIQLNWLPKPAIWPVKVDPSQVDQILANLCVNARDAIAGVGRIAIETANITLAEGFGTDHPGALSGDYVQLRIKDSGCGMDGETLEKAFEPFFTTKETGKGTGLGLATVYGIVKQNNGFIDIDSQPGHGTAFDVYLPRHRGESGETAKESPESQIAHGDETVLVVEDEPAILDITMLILNRCGYKVLTAPSPAEGIRIAREHEGDIHLLITDVIMPGMNGRDLAKEIASIRPRIGQLFMSGYSDDAITHQGVLEEGVNFIEKPFSMQALAARVREVLDGL